MKTTIKSVLILAVGVAAASFTTKTIMEKVSVKSSSITWVGKKVTGKHSGTIDLKDGFFEIIKAQKIFHGIF